VRDVEHEKGMELMDTNNQNDSFSTSARQIAQYFDEHSEPWRAPYSDRPERWWEYRTMKLREDYAIQMISNEPKGTAVDLGCGIGHALIRMRRLGFERVIGVDISRKMLADAARLRNSENMTGSIDLYCCDVRNLKVIKSGSVDACTALGVIEWHPEDAPLLIEMNRILKTGAAAVIQVRNFYCINSRTWNAVQKVIPRYKSTIAYREHRPDVFRASLAQFGFCPEAELYTHFYALYPLTAIPFAKVLIEPLDNLLSKSCEYFRDKAVALFAGSTYILKARKISECHQCCTHLEQLAASEQNK
jgi:SAM-dependent methyltransferase